MDDQHPDSANCHNCGAPLTGPFCAACGQKATSLNITLGDLLHEFAHEMFHVDGKAFRSLRQLFLVPGFLTREHFEGRRMRWVPPVRLYLVLSLVYFGITTLTPNNLVRVSSRNEQQEPKGKIGASVGRQPQASIQTDNESIRELGFQNEDDLRDAVNHARATWAPRAMFLLLPFFAWLVYRAYRDTGRNYPDHMLFALHVHAAWFGAGALVAILGLAVPATETFLGKLLPVYALVYAVFALRRAYGGSTRHALKRAAIIFPIYGMGVLLVTVAVIVPVVFGRKWGWN